MTHGRISSLPTMNTIYHGCTCLETDDHEGESRLPHRSICDDRIRTFRHLFAVLSPLPLKLCAPLGLTHSNTMQEEGQGFLGPGPWSVEEPTALEVTHGGGSGPGCWKACLSPTGWFWCFDSNLWIPSRKKGHLL